MKIRIGQGEDISAKLASELICKVKEEGYKPTPTEIAFVEEQFGLELARWKGEEVEEPKHEGLVQFTKAGLINEIETYEEWAKSFGKRPNKYVGTYWEFMTGEAG